ncbi:MAG: T9SS type A sorting domain-containing protein [Sphingobacteriales bacterium]|nr:MAG: T9SS type A sorting domain-containing protein [Sphingobacteriales bacterium]
MYIKSDHSFIKSVEVFDLMGKSQYFSYSNQTEVFLDTEQFATGTYIVKTTSLNKAVSHHKLLIQ